jgi:hypothetical protein
MGFRISLFQSDPQMIKEIVEAVSIPVMAKVRIGHFVEAQVATFTGKIKAPLIKLYLRVIPNCRYYKAMGSTTSTSQKC